MLKRMHNKIINIMQLRFSVRSRCAEAFRVLPMTYSARSQR